MFGWAGLLSLIPVGFVGGFLFRRRLSGARAVAVWLTWLSLPFVALAGLLVSEIDPSWSQHETSYNLAFGFVFFGIAIAVPWLVANLVGAVLGGRGSRVWRPAPVRAMAPAPARPDSGFPDWSKGDNPRLNYQQIGARMREMAMRAGIDDATLPSVSTPGAADGDYIFLDKFDYVYVRMVGGKTLFEHCSVIADELLYRVFVDRSAALAREVVGASGSHPGEIARMQEAILARIDPRWAHNFAVATKRPAAG